MSYFAFLSRLIAYGDSIRQHWPLILAAYNAIRVLYDAFAVPHDDGALSLLAPATDDELNAEDRLATLIDGDAPSVSLPGRFRAVYQVLKSLGLLDKLFNNLGS